jgi:predicted cupin superfamily sugar epimerase
MSHPNKLPAKAEEHKKRLQLEAHPEGGFYKEFYRSAESVKLNSCERSYGTAIYYLLGPGDFSAFHRIKSDELWFLLDGQGLYVHVLEQQGARKLTLSVESPAAVVEAGKWFAAEAVSANAWALVSCVVVPGFDFQDFQMAEKERLLKLYPHSAELIRRLTI